MISHPAVPAVIAAAIVLVVITLLTIRMSERDQKMSRKVDEAMRALSERIEKTNADGDRQARGDREELSSNLRGMSDSVTRLMSEMARTQQSQLDAFSGQLRDMRHADEDHMEKMRQSVDSRLGTYEGRIDRIGDLLDDKLNKNDARIEKMQSVFEAQMAGLRQENDRRLLEIRATVDEQLSTSLDRRLGESFQQVSARLDRVYQGLGEMQALASGVGELKRVLTDVRARGMMGEIQLGALLNQIMSPEQYEARVAVRPGGAPVDYVIKLPARDGEREAVLPIDAAFSQETHHRLQDALDKGDQAAAESFSARLELELTEHAALIAEQFIAPPATTQFAVMFLPTEGLYAEALRKPGLPDRLQREFGVTLAGPSTLTALLNSLQMGFKTILLEKRSLEVWALLDAVRDEFSEFATSLARTQKRLRQASESIEDATRKSRTIEKRLKGVHRIETPGQNALEDESPNDDDGWN